MSSSPWCAEMETTEGLTVYKCLEEVYLMHVEPTYPVSQFGPRRERRIIPCSNQKFEWHPMPQMPQMLNTWVIFYLKHTSTRSLACTVLSDLVVHKCRTRSGRNHTRSRFSVPPYFRLSIDLQMRRRRNPPHNSKQDRPLSHAAYPHR